MTDNVIEPGSIGVKYDCVCELKKEIGELKKEIGELKKEIDELKKEIGKLKIIIRLKTSKIYEKINSEKELKDYNKGLRQGLIKSRNR